MGNTAEVEELLKDGASVNQQNEVSNECRIHVSNSETYYRADSFKGKITNRCMYYILLFLLQLLTDSEGCRVIDS